MIETIADSFQHPTVAKKSKNRSIEEHMYTSALPVSPLSQGSKAQGSEGLPLPVISPTGENESKVSPQLPQPCGMLPKRPIYISPHPESSKD